MHLGLSNKLKKSHTDTKNEVKNVFSKNLYLYYRNTLYWNAPLKSKNLEISACIKQTFWSFLDYGFNAASKTGIFGLNAAFNIEILINLIKNICNFVYILKITTVLHSKKNV